MAIHLVHDKYFSLALILPDTESYRPSYIRLLLEDLHTQMRHHEALNELLLELYGEDTIYKENQVKTMTINTITLHLKESSVE